MAERFASVPDVVDRLRGVDYLADTSIAGVVYLADRLGKPVLVEGPAGVGKTELAKAVAAITGARLIRLQCYEGLDESKAIYEWNYKKQLLRIQADREHERDWETVESDIFSEQFLLTRPLLEAIRADEPGRVAHRRGRPRRDRDRGAAARGALRLPGVDPRARHDRGQAAPARVPHVEQHPRAVGGAEAPLPVPAHRLPRHRPREGDRAGARARGRRRAGRADRQGRQLDPQHRPEEGAVDLGDDRLGAHARSTSAATRSRPR